LDLPPLRSRRRTARSLQLISAAKKAVTSNPEIQAKSDQLNSNYGFFNCISDICKKILVRGMQMGFSIVFIIQNSTVCFFL
jgi:hypothetical protein